MPQRLGSPFQFGQAVLEPIVQPLYDNETIAAGTAGATRFFITTAAKTELNIFSGITGGGQLSAPRMFVIYGIRLVWSEDKTVADLAPDLKALLYGSWFRMRVGVKNYIEVPSHYLPSGVGTAGYASGLAAAGAQTATSGVPAFFSRFSIEKRRIAIPPQQSFFGELNVETTATVSDTPLWVYLDGEFGQEVQ
ncbi:MAG TPA: hypothetical protein VFH61_06765 [Thermoleophilia bacterium]|nr:hypothetical protein [Thermoleophilia bacterium]